MILKYLFSVGQLPNGRVHIWFWSGEHSIKKIIIIFLSLNWSLLWQEENPGKSPQLRCSRATPAPYCSAPVVLLTNFLQRNIFGQNLPFCINICAMSKRASNCKGALSTLPKLDSNRRERSCTCTIMLQFWSTNWHNFSCEVESKVADCLILIVWIINALLYWLHIFAMKHTSFCVAGNIYRYHLKKKYLIVYLWHVNNWIRIAPGF